MTAVHPEDREAASKAFREGIREGQGFAFETRSLRAKDGTYRWHLNQAVVLRDAEGRVLKFVGTTTDIENQKHAEEAARESEYEARLTVDSIPGMVAVMSPTGNLEIVSRQALEYFGKTIEELRGWGTNDTIHPEDLPGVIDAFSRGIAAGRPYEFSARFRRSDGVYRWFQDRNFPLRDRDGHIVRWYLLITDIDNQKLAEDKLRASEHDLREILDSIPGQVFVMNLDGQAKLFNRRLLEYFRMTVDEMSAWATSDVIHPEDLPRAIEEHKRSVTTGVPYDFELRYRRGDGVYRWFQARNLPIHDSDGGITGWCGLLTDIEDRKRAEEALRESEHESRLIVDSIPGQVAVLSATGEVERVNQPVLDYFGKSLEELRQWAVDDTVHPDDRPGYVQAFQRSFAAGDPFEFEVRTRRFDGVYRWFNVRGLPLRHLQGQIVRWYFIFIEVDDRKRAEEALRQAQGDLARINRVTTMGELAASLAHEVNQPIGGVLINASVCLRKLRHDDPDLDEARAAVTRIQRDAQRAADVIGRIRSQFEKAAPNREVLDLNEIIRGTAALLHGEAVRYNISIRTELAADLPQIIGDRVQLQQVTMNLIVNSLEAMRDVEGIRELAIKSQRDESEQLLVTVSDTGIGFPPQLAEQIFDPFFTTKPHGTGMGLRICRSIIESHGGRLWAASASERGATFHLNLPAATPVPQIN